MISCKIPSCNWSGDVQIHVVEVQRFVPRNNSVLLTCTRPLTLIILKSYLFWVWNLYQCLAALHTDTDTCRLKSVSLLFNTDIHCTWKRQVVWSVDSANYFHRFRSSWFLIRYSFWRLKRFHRFRIRWIYFENRLFHFEPVSDIRN